MRGQLRGKRNEMSLAYQQEMTRSSDLGFLEWVGLESGDINYGLFALGCISEHYVSLIGLAGRLGSMLCAKIYRLMTRRILDE